MNVFGHGYIQGSVAKTRYPLYDSREPRDNRRRFRREMLPALARASSFYCPSGRYASRGWILLARSDYNQINKYSTKLELEISDPTLTDNVGTLSNLCVVQAQCVTRGLSSDSNALYLVELTDARGILSNKWFQFPTTSNYNIRAPAYPNTFHPASMNSNVPVTTTWTWSTMLEDLWTQMSDFLGAWPGLPIGLPFSGTPEGFWLPGVNAWETFNDILEHLGLEIACDLTQVNPFTIVQSGASDSNFTTLQTRYLTHLEDDLEWTDVGAARVPKTVKVLFRRRNGVYGTEETVTYRNDDMAEQWDMKAFYTVDITAPSSFSSAVGTHFIWSDFTVRYDENSNPVNTDVTMANLIATERVSQYFGRIYDQTLGFMTQTYAGALPFSTGSQVDGVSWRQDYVNYPRQGWVTQIVRGMSPPWPELWE